MTATNCPPEYGIDCNCPFEIPAQTVDSQFEFDVPDQPVSPICLLFFLIPLIHSFTGYFDVKNSINNFQINMLLAFDSF